MRSAVKVENLSKRYRLGLTHAGSVRDLVNGAVGRLFGRKTSGTATLAVDQSRVSDDGQFWALRNVDFEVPQGEVMGIIGRNGAGKSTLLKILSRVTTPTSGRVEMRGRVASLLEVGTGFHPEMTGRENVYMNGAILGMSRREIGAKLDDIVEFAGVAAFIDTPVKRYSSGMSVRLGFAVAAHLEPEILIVDEVLAVGDAQFQARCVGKLDDVARSGRTVLFVSHNMQAVRQLTTRCVVIDDGQVVFFGDTASALERYLARSKSRIAEPDAIASIKRASWAGDQAVRFVLAQNLTPVIRNNANMRLRLGVCASVATDYRLGTTLHSVDGGPVATSVGSWVTARLGASPQVFDIEIRNIGLAPGEYWFDVAILRGGRDLFDVVQEVLHFEVSAEGNLPEGITEWSPTWGQCRPAMTCDIRSEESSSRPTAGDFTLE